MNGTDRDTISERKELHAPRAKAPWLAALNPSDRATAERWLNELGGEPRLRRIADAMLKPRRGRGQPPKDYWWLVQRAIEAWLTTSGADASGAAKIAVAALSDSDKGSVTDDRLRRNAREGLEEWMENATWGDMAKIENDLLRRGIALRRDTGTARLEDAIRALTQRLSPPPSPTDKLTTALAAWAGATGLQTPAVMARTSAKMAELGEGIGRKARFATAFPDLFPPETPAREIAAAYELVREALSRDMGRTK